MCNKHAYAYTASKGLGYCFICGYTQHDNGYSTTKERIRSPHIDEIRAYYDQVSRYYHSSLDTKGYAYLKARGYTDEYIQHNRIGFSPSGMNPIYNTPIAQEAGLATTAKKAVLDDRITFPYFYDDQTVVDIRGRAIDKEVELRYKSARHDAYYRGADYVYNHRLLQENKRIIITEGEIKADIPTLHNIPTIALPGMLSWKCGLESIQDHEFIIIYDSQADMRYVWNAIHKTAAHLPNVYVGTLPLLSQDKMDIDTLINAAGLTLFHDVVNTALPYERWKEFARF